MKADRFNEILLGRIEKIKKVLEAKAADYASAADRLHNFKRSAAVMGRTRFEACAAFMTKHLTSIFDIVDKRSQGVFIEPSVIDEKLGDAINYLILLEALLLEDSP